MHQKLLSATALLVAQHRSSSSVIFIFVCTQSTRFLLLFALSGDCDKKIPPKKYRKMEYTLQQKLEGLRQIAQEKLQAILCSIPDTKELFIEPELIKPLEHVCGASWLR